jgi:3-oxoadipate enol-lactonase
MPFVSSHGRDIYYERHGQGPALFFLHGAGSNGATWWQQLPVFKQRYTCMLMDIRCFGRSVAPTSEFQLPLFIDDVLAVLDREQIEKAALIGQSLGGMIGLKTALQHPARVSAFVACDTSMAIDHPRQLTILQERLAKVAGMAIEQRSLGQWFLKNRPAQAALYAQINHFNPSAHRIPAQEWQAALTGLNQGAALTPMAQLRELTCPTLLLVGREDPIVPVDIMQEVQALVAGSELTVIEDAAHSAYFEQPEVFNERVMDFLGRRLR